MSRVVSRREFNLLGLSTAFGGAGALLAPSQARAWVPLEFSAEQPEAQARELAQWFRTEKLVNLPDDMIAELFREMSPATYVAFLRLSAQIYREAEFWVRRQERLPQGWTEQPFINHIKYRQQPRQVYIAWLEGGPDAGQEVIYDENVDKDRIYGHAAGMLGLQAFWLPIDSALAKISSNHSLRDLGPHYLAERFAADTDRWLKAGGDGRPVRVEMVPEAGRRFVTVTWERPRGRPQYYAKKVRMGFDLRKVYVRSVEVWDDNNLMRERIVIDNALARKMADKEFSPDNPDYKF